MTVLSRWWATSLTGLGAVAVLVTVAGCSTQSDQPVGTNPATEVATTTQLVQLDSVADTSDIRNVVALSTHIFTGQVQGVAGDEALNVSPETQFDVLTGIALKGAVPKDVVVNQAGGTVDGVYLSVEGDKPYIVGQWYIFATRILESKGWFTAIPVDGAIEITEQQARDPASTPLARFATAMRSNPQARIVEPPLPATSPSMTFPIPTPGDVNPPPPSPPQPTS